MTDNILLGLLLGAFLLFIVFPIFKLTKSKAFIIILGILLLTFSFVFRTKNVSTQYFIVSFFTVAFVKLLDLLLSFSIWQQSTWKHWLTFLNQPFLLGIQSATNAVYSTKAASLKLLIRGLSTMVSGGFIFMLSLQWHVASISVWLQHSFNFIAFMLFCYDGLWVFFMGFYRFCGGKTILLSNNPLLSATPAEFWRNYNRMASDYFNNYFYKSFKRNKRIEWAVFVPFIISALVHEYMLFASSLHLTGLSTLYLLISGIATLVTLRLKLHGYKRVIGIIVTMIYHYFTLYFLLKAYDIVFPKIYP
ncbi:MAG: hypothetical protein ACOVNR_02200 [Chitinophagaceae bacterium]